MIIALVVFILYLEPVLRSCVYSSGRVQIVFGTRVAELCPKLWVCLDCFWSQGCGAVFRDLGVFIFNLKPDWWSYVYSSRRDF